MIADRLCSKSDVVNWIAREAGFRSYLEISTAFSGFQFGKIDRNQFKVIERVVYCATVDFDDGLPVTGMSFSDDSRVGLEALTNSSQRFDVIFVDPWHTYESSHRDIKSALGLLEPGGVIVVHDCLPPNLEIADPEFRPGSWSGHTYLAFLDIVREHTEVAFSVIDTDFGCGVIQTPNEHGMFSFGGVCRHESLLLDHADWTVFSNFGAEALNLLSPREFVRAFRNRKPSPTTRLFERVERPLEALQLFRFARSLHRTGRRLSRQLRLLLGEHHDRERAALEGRNKFLQECLGIELDNIPAPVYADSYRSHLESPHDFELGSLHAGRRLGSRAAKPVPDSKNSASQTRSTQRGMRSESNPLASHDDSSTKCAACKDVVILMSTFNGAEFVAEQIRSILAQSHSRFVLHIRDDGSTDGTVIEIEAFLSDPRVRLEIGERLGISASFGCLLKKAEHAEVVLYSDQDDVWEPSRVERAVAHLAGTTEPTLYGGAFRLFGADRESSKAFELGGKLGLGNALIQNRFPGCVSAFNGPLLSLLRENPCPAGLFHDHWAYLMASAKGQLVVDTAVVLLKRVHTANATPQPGTAQFLARVKQFRKVRTDLQIFDLPAYELSQIDCLGADTKALIQAFLSGSGLTRKLRLIASRGFWRFPLNEDFLYRISLCTRGFSSEGSRK